jgi:DNA ligase (NAD+)
MQLQTNQVENEVAWRCPNLECKAQIKCRIAYFASKSAMDIDNFGEMVVEKLVDSGRLKTVADIYGLAYDDLIKLPKLGQKSALNILREIDRSKTQPLWRFINGLGIFGIGEQTAKDLCRVFHSMDAIATADAEKLASVDGIGEKIIKSIIGFFSDEHNRSVMESFRRHGLPLPEGATKGQKIAKQFDGKVFALTGVLENFTRAQAVEIIEANGGRISDTISKKTNILICGSNPGTKLTRARELAMDIWDEKMFSAHCNSAD